MNTVMIHGSGGQVLAPFGTPGTFIRGKRIGVMITGMGDDKDTPILVRGALVGLSLDAIFTREQVIEQGGPGLEIIPEGSLLAYASEVIELLEGANRHDAAAALRKIAGDPLDLYVLEPGTFRLIPD